jgi:lipopolysaccharide transport system ATP-binding protein
MSTTPHVSIENVCFNFPLKTPIIKSQNTLGGRVITQNGKNVLQVLNNINFEVSAGMRLALIGSNGAGKSTLLKLISGVFMPSTGKVSITGNLGNAINPSALYRMEGTMQKNVYFALKVCGVENSKISNFASRITKISQLDGFEEFPLYTFSKGMLARLTFAIQFALDYDIRVFDEWIGMGDKSMRSTLESYMNKIRNSTSIFFMASHSETITKRLCTHGLVLERGHQTFFGDINEAIDTYNEAHKNVY